MTVIDRIAAAFRAVVDGGGPSGVREPRRPTPPTLPDSTVRVDR